jgi:AcrR family transcriptional regulator
MIHQMASPLAARADRERQIVAATRALFDEQGVQEAAVDGIAKAVGINKALIYRHVASKEELFILALIDYLGELRDGFPRDDGDPVGALREALDRYAAFCLAYPAFLDCALSLMRRPAAELRERVSEGTWLRLGRAMAECLVPLAALMRAAGVEDADYVANRVYAQVLGTMHLARVGIGVTEAAPGVPGVFAIDPERVRRDCVADALALALDREG